MSLELTIIVPARSSAHCILDGILRLENHLKSKLPALEYEVLVVTNKAEGDHADDTYEVVQKHLVSFPRLKLIRLMVSPGKGAAIKKAMESAHGRYVLFVDSDFPFSLSFIEKALSELKLGADFVTANRRLNESVFRCPVPLLRLVYRRHRLGLIFNRTVRAFLGISSTDTQAGMKAFSRRLLDLALARQTCPTFFFDLEYFLIVKEYGLVHKQIPVEFFLQSEKSTVSLFRDFYLSIYWLIRIRLQKFSGHYGPSKNEKSSTVWKKILTGTWTRNPAGLFFLAARWALTPYARMSRFVPQTGSIVDFGCGHGLFSILLAEQSQARTVLAIDHDGKRIEMARKASTALTNLKFERASFLDPLGEPADCVVILDSLHYVPFDNQADFVDKIFSKLKPGGSLVIREIDLDRKSKTFVNYLYERTVTLVGFTKTVHGKIFPRTAEQWSRFFEQRGFRVMSEPCSHFLFADTLFVCQKPGPEATAKSFISRVTADDWGLSPGVNDGILKLVHEGIVKRVSLMANGKHLGYKLGELLSSGAALGLHFDLTSGETLGFTSKSELLSYLYNPARPLFEKRAKIAEELDKQMARLEGQGVTVEHFDSHHHVHLLPIVIGAIVPSLIKRNVRTVRVPYHRSLWFTSRFALNFLSLYARRTLRKNSFVETPFYYPSKTDLKFRASFARKLSYLGEAEVIVHPAQIDDLSLHQINDPYQQGRVQEFQTLRTLFPVNE